jgi:hypothetical protein
MIDITINIIDVLLIRLGQTELPLSLELYLELSLELYLELSLELDLTL